jgi:hypothetical protein
MLALLFSTNRGSPQTAQPSLPNIVRTSEIARVSQAIPAGDMGRLHYQATEWNARAVDGGFIPEDAIVRPVMRKGNTWYVAVDRHEPTQIAV